MFNGTLHIKAFQEISSRFIIFHWENVSCRKPHLRRWAEKVYFHSPCPWSRPALCPMLPVGGGKQTPIPPSQLSPEWASVWQTDGWIIFICTRSTLCLVSWFFWDGFQVLCSRVLDQRFYVSMYASMYACMDRWMDSIHLIPVAPCLVSCSFSNGLQVHCNPVLDKWMDRWTLLYLSSPGCPCLVPWYPKIP